MTLTITEVEKSVSIVEESMSTDISLSLIHISIDASQMVENLQALLLQTEKRQDEKLRQEAEEAENDRMKNVSRKHIERKLFLKLCKNVARTQYRTIGSPKR